MGELIRSREDCRVCGSRRIRQVLSLGKTPLANEFVRREEVGKPQDRFPLDVNQCEACGHVQLADVVDPERLFRNYVYVSSTASSFVEHFRRYAEEVIQRAQLQPGSKVLEIGSNDGTFLRWFREAGMTVLGVDPAEAIAAEASRQGIRMVPEFFDLALARRLREQGWEVSVVAANNVFAHVDDLHDLLEGVACLLRPDGLFVFEASYLLDVVGKGLFDTVYHEHLSYHSVKPLVGLFERHGMELIDVVRVETHGGSIRGLAKKRGAAWRRQSRVEELIALEQACELYDVATYTRFAERNQGLKEKLAGLLFELKANGKQVAGYGAPAKATTLMFHFGIGSEALDYIVDDSPWKQGLYTPGHHIPIVDSSYLYDEGKRPDYLLILAWNFAGGIIERHRAFRESGGRFIVPLPEVEIR